jgi:hypothetical protein
MPGLLWFSAVLEGPVSRLWCMVTTPFRLNATVPQRVPHGDGLSIHHLEPNHRNDAHGSLTTGCRDHQADPTVLRRSGRLTKLTMPSGVHSDHSFASERPTTRSIIAQLARCRSAASAWSVTPCSGV